MPTRLVSAAPPPPRSSTPVGSPNPAATGLLFSPAAAVSSATPAPATTPTPTSAHFPRQPSHSAAVPPTPLDDSPLLSDHAFRWSASLANWITGSSQQQPRRRQPSLLFNNSSRRGKSRWWDRFVALWWVKPDPTAPPTPRFPRHLHGDTDLSIVAGDDSPGGADHQTAYSTKKRKHLNPRRGVQLVFVLLFLLGLFELFQSSGGGGGQSRRGSQRRRGRRVDSLAKLNLANRDPHKILAQLVPTTSSSSRYSTRITPDGSDSSLWTEDPIAQDLEMYEEASEMGDTTAIVLHWKRTDNVRLVVAHLCRYTFFDSVLVWNNNPDIQLTHKVRAGALLNFFPFSLLLTHFIPTLPQYLTRRLLPPLAAPPRNSESTTRRATSSLSLASSPARKPIPRTATSKTTTGSCAPCGRCIPSLGGIPRDRSWCIRVMRCRCCLDSSGVSTVRRSSFHLRDHPPREAS